MLSASGMLLIAKSLFQKIKCQINGNRKTPITLTDCIMSALAMFSLKYPSLLSFNEDCNNSVVVKNNMSVLYGVKHVPSDTYMRERIDIVDPEAVRKPFKKIFSEAQRGKVLEQFEYLNGYYLASGDATGMFASTTVNCENCCVKEHQNGGKTYYHQMFCVSIVHPKQKTVIPFAPEPIMKSDGMTKNDCEFNAAQRWIKAFRKDHPHIKIIFLADGISSKGPYIKALVAGKMCYILGAKPGDHKALFKFVEGVCEEYKYRGRDGKIHHYRYMNNVPLNDSNPDILVNFLDYTETSAKGKVQRFTWVTNILITKENIHEIMIGGRTRWKIENETFNTLKNQNYQFEHNFGHGNKNLSTVFAMLMMLAFLIDQIQEFCDHFFQQALRKKKRKQYLWRALFGLFANYKISSWEDVWKAIAFGHQEETLRPNSS
jgi:hypothetical protein